MVLNSRGILQLKVIGSKYACAFTKISCFFNVLSCKSYCNEIKYNYKSYLFLDILSKYSVIQGYVEYMYVYI